MEKKEYLKPEIEVVLMITECNLLAASGNPGEEVDEGDNAAKGHKFDDFSNSLFEDDEF